MECVDPSGDLSSWRFTRFTNNVVGSVVFVTGIDSVGQHRYSGRFTLPQSLRYSDASIAGHAAGTDP